MLAPLVPAAPCGCFAQLVALVVHRPARAYSHETPTLIVGATALLIGNWGVLMEVWLIMPAASERRDLLLPRCIPEPERGTKSEPSLERTMPGLVVDDLYVL